MSDMLWKVESRKFSGGVMVNKDGLITEATPVLGQWPGSQLSALREYCADRGWKITPVVDQSKVA